MFFHAHCAMKIELLIQTFFKHPSKPEYILFLKMAFLLKMCTVVCNDFRTTGFLWSKISGIPGIKFQTGSFPEFAQNLPKNHLEFTQNLPRIYPKFTQNLPGIYPEFIQNQTRIYPEFIQNLPRIYQEFPNIYPEFTQILSRIYP